MVRRPPRSTLFPYTTLFRSARRAAAAFLAMEMDEVSTDDVADTLGELVNIVGGNVKAIDRKSTRLNSSHVEISYAVFCLKKKTEHRNSVAGPTPRAIRCRAL